MTTATATKTVTHSDLGAANHVEQVIPFASICEPGAYVCNWSGHLLRVPQDAVTAGRSPLIDIVGPDCLFVTKICNDPFVTLTKARLLACNFDIAVNF